VTDPFDFAERAAILEHEGRLLRADAERQALGEIIDRAVAQLPDGIVGELSAAARHRRRPEVEEALGLRGKRAPAWGIARILPDGRNYRPATPDGPGRPAIIVPATVDGTVVDLVAEDMATGLLHSRLDIAEVVGADQIERARLAGRPLLAFAGVSSWLRGGSSGIVVVNWRHIAEAVDGIPAILTPTHLARRMYDATARCTPRPAIGVPDKPKDVRRAR
jgi:hypothetical protein